MKRRRPRLGFSHHALERMKIRGITYDDVRDVIKEGEREPLKNGCIMHWSPAAIHAHVGVVVNWREMMVVTVINLSAGNFDKLYQKWKETNS